MQNWIWCSWLPQKSTLPAPRVQDGTLCCSSISNRAIRPSIEAVISARHLWPSSPQKDMYQTCVKIKNCVWWNLPMSDAAANMRTSQLQCMCMFLQNVLQIKLGEFQKAPPGGAPWKEVPLDCLAFHFLYPRMLKATMAANSTNPNTTASPMAPALDAVALLDPEAAQTQNPRLQT